MKFYVDSSIFKSAMERAVTVTRKKGALPFIHRIKLVADQESNTVCISASNIETWVKIYCNTGMTVNVVESGEMFLDTDTIKRLFNVTGYVQIYSGENQLLYAKNDKKAAKIQAVADTDFPDFPGLKDKIHVAEVDKDDFLGTMENMQYFVSDSETRPVYTCVNLNSGEKRMSAVSGYHLLDRAVDWSFFSEESINIPILALKELKKISSKGNDNFSLELCEKKKYLRVVGSDFEYFIHLVEGVFLNVEKSFPYSTACEFSLDTEKLANVAKEYTSYNSAQNKLPMYFARKGYDLAAVYRSMDFETCDVMIGSFKDLPEGYVIAMNPDYMKNVADVFKKFGVSVTVKCENNSHTPWMFYGDNGYRALVLPVRMREDAADAIFSMLGELIAA